ncbi:MAG: 1,4-dihydroxy-6-naphthoate synthase [Bacteroidetes bacterium]|nr:1,4-dihydroxy-6-naphthoate synthase [Bacteroidota bacterium]
MKLTIGFSPCPNDTFIFDALINNKIDTHGISFNVLLEDVETLNKWALEGKLDITKLSFPAFFQSTKNYSLLNSGSALGNGVGPLLISKEKKIFTPEDVMKSTILIPGVNTTANLLFSFAYPDAINKKYTVFSEIEDAVMNGEADLGVIIHESRFTFQEKGLYKIADLGEVWEKSLHCPIPLGGIAIRQSMDKQIAQLINQLVHQSLEYSFSHYPIIAPFIKEYAQTMSEDVMRKHIDLYVNDFSLDLGVNGRAAIHQLYQVFCSVNKIVPKGKIDLLLSN